MSALPSALRLVVAGGASRNHRVGAARQVRGTPGTSVPNASADRSPAEQGVRRPGTSTCFAGCARRPTRSSTPVFRRELEMAWAGALPVPRDARAGGDPRQLPAADGPFAPVRGLLDRTWFLDVDPGLRRDRLVARHVPHGRSPAAAEHWVACSDDRNAELVEATRSRADDVVRLEPRYGRRPNQTAATPIRPLRVTRPASSRSDRPSVPTGRRGSTMCRDSALASQTVISTSAGTS